MSNKLFNKIYYINLDRRPDREEHIIQQLEKVNLLNISTRVTAIDGKLIDLSSMPNNLITEAGIQDALDKSKRVYVPLTIGGIGCALSHRNIWLDIINNNVSSALILEDDSSFSDDFSQKLQMLEENIPTNYDMIFLGYHRTSIKYLSHIIINKYFKKPLKIFGLFGYVVSKKGAAKLLKMFPITEQIDSEIGNNINKLKFNIYTVLPTDRIIFSDSSSVHTKFGTDIQVREPFGYSVTNYNMYALFLIYIIFSYLVYKYL